MVRVTVVALVRVIALIGIDTLTTITCQYRWLAHSGSQQNQSFAIAADNPKRLRERLYCANVSKPFEPLPVGARQIFRREIDPAAGDGSVRKSTLTQRAEKSCNIRLEWVFVYTSAAQAVGNR